VRAFLIWLTRERGVAAPTLNQALAALQFVYRDVLEAPLDAVGALSPARRPHVPPNVLWRGERPSPSAPPAPHRSAACGGRGGEPANGPVDLSHFPPPTLSQFQPPPTPSLRAEAFGAWRKTATEFRELALQEIEWVGSFWRGASARCAFSEFWHAFSLNSVTPDAVSHSSGASAGRSFRWRVR
jgi:hypothetical protein